MRLVLLLLLAALPVWAAKTPKGVLSNEDCPSQLYLWSGKHLECQTVDRVEVLLQQRNVNFQGLEACRSETDFLRGLAVLDVIYQRARSKCREQGKRFDEIRVECTGSLSEEKE